MNELLDTERAYVEELLCVLEVRSGMGAGVSLTLHHSFILKLLLELGLLAKTYISSNSGDRGRRIIGSKPVWGIEQIQDQLKDFISK